MKNLLFISLLTVMFPLMALSQNSYTISGRLLEQVTETINIPPVTSTDCDGNTVTLTSPPLQTTRMKSRSFTTITIKVYLGTSATGSPVATFPNLTKTQIKWNGQTASPFTPATSSDTAKFEYELTGIPKSRISYTAFVYLDAGTTSVYSEEFLLNSVAGIPIGTIWPYMGDGNDLSDLEVGGWFLCDGRDIDADLNANLTEAEQDTLIALFTRSGKYQPGRLPDLRGRFLRGMDKGTGNDPDAASRAGGSILGSVQSDEFKSHGHTGTAADNGAHRHSFTTGNDDFNNYGDDGGAAFNSAYVTGDLPSAATNDNGTKNWGTGPISQEGTHSHTLTINANGGSESRPKNVYVNYIIKCVK